MIIIYIKSKFINQNSFFSFFEKEAIKELFRIKIKIKIKSNKIKQKIEFDLNVGSYTR